MPHFVRSGLVALVSLSATAGASAQAAFMSKAEIQKEIIGKTFSSVTEKGKPMPLVVLTPCEQRAVRAVGDARRCNADTTGQ